MWRGFARWWLAELRQAMPKGWLDLVQGRTPPQLLIRAADGILYCTLTNSSGERWERRVPVSGIGDRGLLSVFDAFGLSRNETRIGFVVNHDAFLVRELKVPAVARHALNNIVEQDICHRTPFEANDVWHGVTDASTTSADRILHIRHWIIPKKKVHQIFDELRLPLETIDFLTTDGDGAAAPIIPLRERIDERSRFTARIIASLAVAALVAPLLGVMAFDYCQSSLADSLEDRLVAVKASVVGDRKAGGRLDSLRSDVEPLRVWNELSRLLPDQTFLTEFRFVNNTATISGFSDDAARLVRLLDSSPLFRGAFLVEAITPDQAEHKDRFKISFETRLEKSTGPSIRPRG
jgi:general secretion pathway protein L